MAVALIAGAGWSAAAGYPLPQDLLRGPVYASTETSRERVQAVLDAYRAWGRDAPETFLAEVRAGRIRLSPDPADPSLFDASGGRPLPWRWAVEAIVLRLLWPGAAGPDRAHVLAARADFRKRDGGHLGEPIRAETHKALLAGQELAGVVTTGYDTLTEGLLGAAGFHYGGLPRPQRARGASAWEYYNEPDPDANAVELGGRVPLCKLHGSLNWELDAGRIAIWRDMRLPHRDAGSAAIATRLEPVWHAAAEVLAAAERWIVVGCSAAGGELRRLLESAARGGVLRSVALHDPASERLRERWEEIAGVPVEAHDGLAAPPARASRRLSSFHGIQAYMLFPPAAGETPHFRARHLADRASIGLASLDVIEGSLPDSALALVREWARAHRDELERNWRLGLAGEPEARIAPLQ